MVYMHTISATKVTIAMRIIPTQYNCKYTYSVLLGNNYVRISIQSIHI